MIDRYWVKFDENGIVDCMCNDRRQCPPEKKPDCKEYVVKFIEVERQPLEDLVDRAKELETSTKNIQKKIKSELEKSLKTIKGFKI